MIQKEFTLENFTVNESNEWVHAAITAIVENDEVIYNPLLILGNSSPDKTHLLQATLNELQARNKKVRYFKGQELSLVALEELLVSDVTHLILDDLQDSPALEQFHSSIEHFINANRQLILSPNGWSDKDIADKGLNRLKWGLTVSMDGIEE